MFRLPVSGLQVDLHQFTGAEDMLLLESDAEDWGISIAMAERLAHQVDGEALDAAALPATDVEALLLEQRRVILGDDLNPRAQCGQPGCAAQIDVSFRISNYLEYHRPRMPRIAGPLKEQPGWFRLHETDVSFRLVTAGDLMAIQGLAHPEKELAVRTMRPQPLAEKDIRRVQQAMEAMAPPLSRELEGRCPECNAAVRLFFNPRTYVQRELRFEAAFLYEDVHLLATRYHWSEEKILSLPRTRRVQYAELAVRSVT